MQDFKLFFETGWTHIISPDALDHILFILALGSVYTIRNLKKVLILVTAFTIGHSLTLLLSVLDVIRFSSDWVEFLIPVSIVLMAVWHLVNSHRWQQLKTDYVLAAVFGLVHGMGFANIIRFMLAANQDITVPLLSFNLGVEAGQIALVSVILFLQWLIVQKAGLPQRIWIIVLCSIAGIWGLWMALQRIPF